MAGLLMRCGARCGAFVAFARVSTPRAPRCGPKRSPNLLTPQAYTHPRTPPSPTHTRTHTNAPQQQGGPPPGALPPRRRLPARRLPPPRAPRLRRAAARGRRRRAAGAAVDAAGGRRCGGSALLAGLLLGGCGACCARPPVRPPVPTQQSEVVKGAGFDPRRSRSNPNLASKHHIRVSISNSISNPNRSTTWRRSRRGRPRGAAGGAACSRSSTPSPRCCSSPWRRPPVSAPARAVAPRCSSALKRKKTQRPLARRAGAAQHAPRVRSRSNQAATLASALRRRRGPGSVPGCSRARGRGGASAGRHGPARTWGGAQASYFETDGRSEFD